MSKTRSNTLTRREFLRGSAAASLVITVVAPRPADAARGPLLQRTRSKRYAIFAALGDTLIPTDPGDPGYKSLEPYKITEEVMRGVEALEDKDIAAFNNGSVRFFQGKTFIQLTEAQRANYLKLIINGGRFNNKEQLKVLQRVYRQTRTRVFTLFYQNYPENEIPRDDNGVPILQAGDTHQITNPNSKKLVTGWDIAGFNGPLTWEEEEERRAKYKVLSWQH